MADNLSPIWSPLIMHQYSHPDNLPEPDFGTINLEQRTEMDGKLKELRKQQLYYLSTHPEIRGIIREFFNQLLNFMPPSELIPKFCRDFFGQCRYELKLKVDKRTREILKNWQKKGKEYERYASVLDIGSDWHWSSDSSQDSEEPHSCEM